MIVESWDVNQAAAYLRCRPEHVRRLAAAGSIPARKPGKHWVFDPESLQSYVRGEWRSTNVVAGAVGGLDSTWAAGMFDAAPARPTGRRPKSTSRRFEIVSGGKQG
ncbi:MAG: helix-turn-helix domain-containing protein [Steroidobacteraceae bacterium]